MAAGQLFCNAELLSIIVSGFLFRYDVLARRHIFLQGGFFHKKTMVESGPGAGVLFVSGAGDDDDGEGGNAASNGSSYGVRAANVSLTGGAAVLRAL